MRSRTGADQGALSYREVPVRLGDWRCPVLSGQVVQSNGAARGGNSAVDIVRRLADLTSAVCRRQFQAAVLLPQGWETPLLHHQCGDGTGAVIRFLYQEPSSQMQSFPDGWRRSSFGQGKHAQRSPQFLCPNR